MTHHDLERSVERRTFVRRLGLVGATAATAPFVWPASSAAAAPTTGTFLDQGGGVFNVRAYGAVGSGTTDDTVAIKRAITAARNAGGGVVFFPSGQYLISSVVEVSSSGISIVGAGQHATTILASPSNQNNDVIRFSNTSAGSLRMLQITSQSQRRNGAAIHIVNSSRIYVDDVDISNMYCGCLISGTSGLIYIDRGYWTSFTPNTGSAVRISTNPGNAFYISNLIIDNPSDQQPLAGLLIDGNHVEEVVTRACDILHAGTGLLITSPQTKYGFFSDTMWDSCAAYGIHIAPSSGGPGVLSLHFVDCWCSANIIDGCRLEGPGGIDGVQFHGHRFYASSSGNGLIAYGPATNVFVDGCGASYNGPSAGGFVFTGNCSGFAVRNSRSGAYAGFGVRQSNGIFVDNGCNNYLITGNLLAGNATAGINDNGGPSKVVANNL